MSRMTCVVPSTCGFGLLVEDVLDTLVDQRDDVWVDHFVQDPSPVSSPVDPASQTQLGKMLADPGLGTADGAHERGDVKLVLGKEPEQMEPARGAEQLEDLRGVHQHVPIRCSAAGYSCHRAPDMVA